jgi:hypothetical protein
VRYASRTKSRALSCGQPCSRRRQVNGTVLALYVAPASAPVMAATVSVPCPPYTAAIRDLRCSRRPGQLLRGSGSRQRVDRLTPRFGSPKRLHPKRPGLSASSYRISSLSKHLTFRTSRAGYLVDWAGCVQTLGEQAEELEDLQLLGGELGLEGLDQGAVAV